jgi:hypothetical protein
MENKWRNEEEVQQKIQLNSENENFQSKQDINFVFSSRIIFFSFIFQATAEQCE